MCSHAAGIVYNAQRMNTYLREHWKAFARQPYFDEQGIFISAVVSAPLLVIMLVQLVRCQAASPCDNTMPDLVLSAG